mgnify:CR=1 FL=1
MPWVTVESTIGNGFIFRSTRYPEPACPSDRRSPSACAPQRHHPDFPHNAFPDSPTFHPTGNRSSENNRNDSPYNHNAPSHSHWCAFQIHDGRYPASHTSLHGRNNECP